MGHRNEDRRQVGEQVHRTEALLSQRHEGSAYSSLLTVAAMRVSNEDGSLRQSPQLQSVLGIVDHLRRRLARFKLGAHFLDLRCLLVEKRSKLRHGSSEILR